METKIDMESHDSSSVVPNNYITLPSNNNKKCTFEVGGGSKDKATRYCTVPTKDYIDDINNPTKTANKASSSRFDKFTSSCATSYHELKSSVTSVFSRHYILLGNIVFFVLTSILIYVVVSQSSFLDPGTNGPLPPHVQGNIGPIENDKGSQIYTNSQQPILDPNLLTNNQNTNFIPPSSSAYTANTSHKKFVPQEVVLYSQIDLRFVTEKVHTIIVSNLMSPAVPAPSGLSTNCCTSVKNLLLKGPISQEWLHYLLSSFKNVEIMEVDADRVVSAWAATTTNNNNLAVVRVPLLREIYAENARKSAILEWGFTIEMPNLKVMSIKTSVFDEKSFSWFEKLMTQCQDSIERIEITESSLCEKCDLTRLQFSNLMYMKISRAEEDEDDLDEGEDDLEDDKGPVIPGEFVKNGGDTDNDSD